MDYRNTKTPSIQRRLDRETLSQLAFLGKSNLNFPWEKSHWDNTVVKVKLKKNVKEEEDENKKAERWGEEEELS